MRAIQFIESIPCYLLTRAAGAVYRPAFWGPLSMLRYREVAEPALPGPQWVRVKTRYGGICGSDMHTVQLQDSPMLSAFLSFPFTLGHENVGTIAEAGAEVAGFAPGDRVVVESLLPCAARGIAEPCDFCRRGEYSLCRNFSAGEVAPGFALGSCSGTGGSWSPYFVAHRSQLFAVPANVSDENALMVDAFCSALRPVMRDYPADDDTVLVLGAGVMGLCVIAALRALGSKARVLAVARYPFQGEMASAYGADEVINLRGGDCLQAVAQATGARVHRPLLGKPALVGGAGIVYECTGSAAGIDDSLRLANSGGTVVLVGLASILRGVDWTPIWLHELTIRGSFWCSFEKIKDRTVRAFALALEWMAEGRLDLAPMVTHRFPLDAYKKALAVTAARGRHSVVKSVFVFD
jgi:threonine dehydrogenase-like Zn-dependent dehydrogenase